MTRARSWMLAAVVTMSMVVIAPADAASPSPTVSPSPAQQPSLKRPQAVSRWSGFYFTDRMLATANDGAASVRTATPCADLVAALGASQWKVNVVVTTPFLAVIERGDSFGILTAMGTNTFCSATIAVGEVHSVSTSGAETFNGQARVYPLQCLVVAESASMILIYEQASGDFRMVLSASIPAVTGSHPLLEKGVSKVVLGRNPVNIVELLRAAPGSDDAPAWAHTLQPEDTSAPTGTVNVRSVEPLVGELVITGLRDEAGQAATVKAGFRCNSASE